MSPSIRQRLDAPADPEQEARARAAHARGQADYDREVADRIGAEEFPASANGGGPDDDEGDALETDGALGAIPDYPAGALPACARELVAHGVAMGLPAALLGGAALGALAAAIGPAAEIEVTPVWHQRAIVWIAGLAPRGAGKSPAQDMAFAPLREHDAQVREHDDDDDDGGTEILLGDQTLEALARTLHESGGAGALDADELSVLLSGIGEYKRGGGGDHGRLLSLWTGSPWGYTRAGGGGNKTNAVKLRVERPTLVICGGLQTGLHELLGDEETGLRPRWLPHIGVMPESAGTLARGAAPVAWQTTIAGALIPARETRRKWRLDDGAHDAFEGHRRAWKAQAHTIETATTSGALIKADTHCARVALVLAEADAPAAGGQITAELIDRAAAIVAYTLDCWRALPEQGGMSLNYRDGMLDRSIPRLVAWLDEHGGVATRRDLQRAHVAGVRTAKDLDLLLGRYDATYPGTVADIEPERGGLPVRTVRSPLRRAVSPLSPQKRGESGRTQHRL